MATPTIAAEPFAFYTEKRLVVLTGRKASNLEELLNHLTQVAGSCIFYHTHYLYLSHHFEKPRFYNEFANWTSRALQEERLAERLAAIDLLAITSIREIREAITGVIRKHLEGNGKILRECPPGDEFHFCEAKSFILPTGLLARDVPEFFEMLGKVTNSCLHFHFFEARLRLETPTNDFSQWLAARGETRLARRIDRLNPYAMTLDELKHEIVKLGRRYRV
ncbi:MAG TPA: DUF5752 family protein [Bryobacteraceae bacterium]|nr:DUF5752 family protein [Bryobacteraceae bacterium]